MPMIHPFQSFKYTEPVPKSSSASEWRESHAGGVGTDILSAVHQLMTAVASSSGGERVLSAFGIVHPKLRNRLGAEKASKLALLFKSMNKYNFSNADDP